MTKKHVKKLSKQQRRKVRKQLKEMVCFILSYIRVFIEFLIDKVFGYFYDSKKEIVPETTNPILLQNVVSLSKSIQQKELTSEEIVRAFIERAKQVNPIINAIVDERFEDAIQEAKNIDADIANGKITNKDFESKPFLGLPFTTKDTTACKGMLFTFGLISRKDERAKEDADVVKAFKEAGAILVATTNVPEVNMWQETRNLIIGETKNPYNTTRTVGGSSGGESSLIASCGSLMGIGTDIGGSLRMPAYYCGIFAHKPTNGLVSTKGLTTRTGLEVNTMVTAGPMCRYASDLIPMLKVLCKEKQTELQLDDPVNISNVNIFYALQTNDLRTSQPSSEVRSMMEKVIQVLKTKLKYNEQMPQEIEFEEMKYSFRLWRHEMTKESLDFPLELGNRTKSVNVYVELPKKILGLSDFTLGALSNLINTQIFPAENPEWAEETLTKLKNNILETLGENGVLLFPSCPSTAVYHYVPFLRPYNISCWSIFNALRFPVTQVPLGLSVDGLPMGVQVVTAPYNDRLSIAVAKVLEEEFGGWTSFLADKKQQ